MSAPVSPTTAVQAAIAIRPRQPDSLHLTEIPRDEPGPGQVLLKIRQVGVCGTDRELMRAHFGSPPPGEEVLVLGHEMLGEVVAIGPGVEGFAPGDLATATVRRPDDCPACAAGQPDMCQWHQYTERGIGGLHGYMTETVVEEARWLVPVPKALAEIGILTEPLSVVEKALRQANLIQRRINSWDPKTAIVFGSGPIGILGTLMLRERGIDVVTIGRRPKPLLAAEIVAAAGARYMAARESDLKEIAAELPPIDLILEASGRPDPLFPAMEILGNNGVLVLLSGGRSGEAVMVSPAAINGSLLAVADLARFEALWPGLASRLITRRVEGLPGYRQILEQPAGDIKTVIDV